MGGFSKAGFVTARNSAKGERFVLSVLAYDVGELLGLWHGCESRSPASSCGFNSDQKFFLNHHRTSIFLGA